MADTQHQEDIPPPDRLDLWTQEQFIALLLLYASYADYEYSEEERNHILNFVQPYTLSTVEVLFNRLGEFRQLDLILKLKERFVKTSDERDQLLDLLNSHFHSDGEFTKLESGLYNFLKRLI